ncbi:long tail fiber protein [Escherichia phage vB_EcoS_ESCO30]|uniref:Long tail fiber protein n=1 Tax=Escherichia phage vB_EcoS_ESCO30 TaxID=2918879 RepID=A0AAE9HMZ0_9CAUD|nr:long tail fiber protein [Escherichia phage vB_EcoS_ESCO30]
MAITKIILQQMVTMDQNSITASKYPKYTVVLSNSISSITAGELTTAIESSKASAAAAKQSEINAKQSELNAKDSENEAEISAASSQQSATQSASSATASANSAKAAKTSETNAKASETAAKTSETNAKASETAAKTSETNANSSKTAAAASASAAKTSETNAAASASAAKTSETNANSSKTAAANSASAAKASETNAKTSETNAAASATKAENAASGMRDSIGLGNAPRNCPDISGNPSAYIGFMRIMSTAVGFPSIASGESSLTGFISQVDGSPAYTGVFQGWASRSLYTYRWASNIGPQWTRHARKNEVDKLVQLSSETHLLNPGDNAKIIITSNKLWGAYDIENRTYIPLAVGQGGTGGRSAAEARANLQLNRFQRSSDTRTIVCSTDVQADGCYLQVDASGQWGAFNPITGKWQPLAIAQGGTGALNTSDARRNLEVMYRRFSTLTDQNLNDLTGESTGFYYQGLSANATAARNYPIQEAGNLMVLQNGANGVAGCCQIYITFSTNRIYERSYNPGTSTWSAWGSILNSYDPSYCRQLIELGSQHAPLFAGLALTGYSNSTVAAGGIINSYLRATDGTQRVRMRLYPEKLADGVAAATLQVMGEDTGPSYKTFHFKHNGQLYVPNEINTETISVRDLTVTQRNLGIPTTGFMGDYQTINAPAGAVDGKYYPVIFYTGGTSGYGITPVPIFVRTPGRSASHEMNNNVFSGYVACGGWSDSPTMAHGMFTTYDPNELGILCIKGSNKDYSQHIAVYVHYKAFPVNIMTDPKVVITVPTEDYVLGTNGVKFKFGVTDAGDGNTEGNVSNILNFTGGGSGYYSTHPFRQGLSNNFALTNNLSTGDAFSATAPSFTFNGSVVGANSYSARGDAVTKNTYISQLVNSADNIVGQSEFRATEEAGQIIVRDMTSSASHKFFNFNKDGTFSAPSGILSSTGIDWNTQHNIINKFYGIAGQVNSPENNVVFGGVHIGFSGNFATQLAGRGSRYYLRSIESGTIGAWNRIITDQYADFKAQIFANKNGEAITIKSTVNDNSESGYIAGRNNTNTRLWYVGKSGPQETVVIRNEMNGNQILLRDGAGDISLDTKGGNKVVYANASNFRLINSNGKYTRLVTSGTSTHAISLDNWGTTTRPTVFECKYENPSTSANVGWIFYGQVNTDGSRVFQVNGAVNCVTLNQSSDRDLKDNIKPIKDATNALRKMNGYTYTLKEDGLPYAGVIAQEVMEALPEAVSGFTKYTDLEGPTLTGEQLVGEERFYSVDYGAITGLLVQVSRESDSRITALESEVSDLKKQIADLTLVVNSLLANRAQ